MAVIYYFVVYSSSSSNSFCCDWPSLSFGSVWSLHRWSANLVSFLKTQRQGCKNIGLLARAYLCKMAGPHSPIFLSVENSANLMANKS